MDELLKLTKENNIMLKQILSILCDSQSSDFASNVLANILADKIMNK